MHFGYRPLQTRCEERVYGLKICFNSRDDREAGDRNMPNYHTAESGQRVARMISFCSDMGFILPSFFHPENHIFPPTSFCPVMEETEGCCG